MGYLLELYPCLLFMVLNLFFYITVCQEVPTDTLSPYQTLPGFLESSNRLFRLYFAREGDRSYLGIHYLLYDYSREDRIAAKFIPVWVAFPETSFYRGSLTMEPDGQLVVRYWQNVEEIVGKSIALNVDQPTMIRNSDAKLLDNGNFVVRDGKQILWQSFDYPSNTWLPGMKIGVFSLNNKYNNNGRRLLTSWITGNNPSPGGFKLGIDPSDRKQIWIMKRGFPYWRSGSFAEQNYSTWVVYPFYSSLENMTDCISNGTESYCILHDSQASFFRLTHQGTIEFITQTLLGEVETCEDGPYRLFRSLGYCIATDQTSSAGSTSCKSKVMVPTQVRRGTMDGWSFYTNSTGIGLIDCHDLCKQNCSCAAYTNASSDGTGCKFSTTQPFNDIGDGETIYFLREFAGTKGIIKLGNHQKNLKKKVGAGAAAAGALLLILNVVFVLKRIIFNRGTKKEEVEESADNDRLITFSLLDIQIATNNFCDANKLGQGGYGLVYKGKLQGGQEIAVKRLCTVSKHGIEQFKNEVVLISKLQHRNLVSLLGYCSEGEERLLVYEYLPNKSLDSFIFDVAKQACLLNWKMRVNIIQGIAQGLLYLHKYSRLKIIHRDLKTSNILLDKYMNPKIADFGTARIFQDTDSRLNTKRIIGTYGYMSPEYAIDGHFSEKSDVFSFGVMLLEIISGKKNTGFYNSNHLNLLGYVWDLWTEGRIIDMVDPTLSGTFCITSGSRYVQVGLLCVQENAADRPVMIDVVSMLTNDSITLPIPSKPAFCSVRTANNGQNFVRQPPFSDNKLTISTIEGR